MEKLDYTDIIAWKHGNSSVIEGVLETDLTDLNVGRKKILILEHKEKTVEVEETVGFKTLTK